MAGPMGPMGLWGGGRARANGRPILGRGSPGPRFWIKSKTHLWRWIPLTLGGIPRGGGPATDGEIKAAGWTSWACPPPRGNPR